MAGLIASVIAKKIQSCIDDIANNNFDSQWRVEAMPRQSSESKDTLRVTFVEYVGHTAIRFHDARF